MRHLGFVIAVTLLGAAAELKPHTLATWEHYVQLTEARVQAEVEGRSPFLWIDRLAGDKRQDVLVDLSRGEIVVEKLETREPSGRKIDVEDGIIHHWVGTVLMPDTPIEDVLSVVRNYDQYDELFAPLIQRSRVASHEDSHYTVAIRTSVKKVITVVMDMSYVIDYRRLSPTRMFATTVARDLYQVHDAGEPGERRQPGDEADGYLWRFQMWCAFDERDAGTYEQCESVSLTRGVPWLFAPIVKPFVNGIPRDTLEFTLGKVRDTAVHLHPGTP